jgi:hypothetical protein
MLLMLILPVWVLGLLLVAGLCFTARLGDSEQARVLSAELLQARANATGDARRVAPQALSTERTMQAPRRRELAA